MQNNNEQKYFDIVLIDLGQNKYEAIKMLVEEIGMDSNLALQIESKLPYTIKTNVPNNEAYKLKKKFENIDMWVKFYKSNPNLKSKTGPYRPKSKTTNKQRNNSTTKKINIHKYTTIKVWLIIGCILTPIALAASLQYTLGSISMFFLLDYIITIPACSTALWFVRNANSPSELTTTGILSLIFVSIIGGIIILCINETDFEQPQK